MSNVWYSSNIKNIELKDPSGLNIQNTLQPFQFKIGNTTMFSNIKNTYLDNDYGNKEIEKIKKYDTDFRTTGIFRRSAPLNCRKNENNQISTDPVFSWPPKNCFLNFNKASPTRHSWSENVSMDIDEEEDGDKESHIHINGLHNWTSNNNLTCAKYRENITKKFRYKCVISHIDWSECECAHIIPRKICDRYQLKFKYDSANGLLLNRNLHTSFDNFVWTFDIFDIKYETNKDFVLLSTITVPEKKNYTINQYRYEDDGYTLKYHKLPIDSLPYLYVHYNIFLDLNYKVCSNNDRDQEYILYEKALQDKFFQEGLFDPKSFVIKIGNKMSNTREAKIILDHSFDKSSLPIYLVLWNYHPHHASSWEYKRELDPNLIASYELLKGTRCDPDYVI